ncbi:YdcF family protein [Mesorhizobium sp. B292B1B]|uniref:YdcF family protein n=1 Tax=unclassified Mesorhizobium TaxID=325217 RepID=UPI0011291A0C|nr:MULTISPECIES: YdcF family protein [unclassified Mesorhizobium]MBZ9964120.1 YdcF family protein [Mesorhizobium sp. BR1-1-2]MCA0011222.1 YdcF family protein [Mesorhizobium sp. B294B1A1]MCA0037207.1 YdcF family protein [Mesorhizobium sp. B292B1B]TPM40337.1 YdcF family protein [Mesorhizobium sp. B2-3-2]
MMEVRDSTSTVGPMPALAARPHGRDRVSAVLRVSSFALLTLVALFAGGFGWFANTVSHLTTPANPARADAIIVLTGGQSRLDAAMELLASGKGARLLISGVHPSASRRQLQAATGGDSRLFSCCVDIDRAALDTIGNAEESAKWVESHAYGTVILVTNNYHMPRSLLEMGRLLHKAKLEPYPVVNSNLDNGGWLTKPRALRVLFTEYNKYLLALARGIVPVKPTPDGIALAEIAAGS